MSEGSGDVTRLLGEIRGGNPSASEELIPLIYNELHRLARACMNRERAGHTLQATALVNEAYLRLAGQAPGDWQNRAHFFAIAARTMRQILIDYARRHSAGKRGGPEAQKVELDVNLLVTPETLDEVLAVDSLLDRLEQIDPRQSRLVELRFFTGLSFEEAAEVMGLSAVTLKREWRSAKAWLFREWERL